MINGVTRREFVRTAGAAAVGTLAAPGAGAMSCLTGIARESCDTGQPVDIADLVRL